MEEIKSEVAKVRQYRRVADIPPNTLFRLAKSGTLYFKTADGSIRNAEKAAKKLGLLNNQENKSK